MNDKFIIIYMFQLFFTYIKCKYVYIYIYNINKIYQVQIEFQLDIYPNHVKVHVLRKPSLARLLLDRGRILAKKVEIQGENINLTSVKSSCESRAFT